MSNSKENNIEIIVRTAVKKMVDQETYEWPPQCTMILYQPKRPQRNISHVESKKAK